jgi:hypothetical protein
MFDNLEYIFLPGHDERYAHIPPEQRHEYPDEIFDKDLNVTIVERVFTKSELRRVENRQKLGRYWWDAVGKFGDLIFAKDVSLSAAAEDKRQFDEMRRRNGPRLRRSLKREKELALAWGRETRARVAEKDRLEAEAARRQIAE